MTHWHISVEHLHQVDDNTVQQVSEALLDAGASTVTTRWDRGTISVSFTVEATTLRQATEAGQRRAREIMRAAGVTGPAVRYEQITDEQLEIELRQPTLPELVGVTEAAAILGVSRQRVAQLEKAHDDFPARVADLASGPVYTADSIRAFNERWERKRTGRPPKDS